MVKRRRPWKENSRRHHHHRRRHRPWSVAEPRGGGRKRTSESPAGRQAGWPAGWQAGSGGDCGRRCGWRLARRVGSGQAAGRQAGRTAPASTQEPDEAGGRWACAVCGGASAAAVASRGRSPRRGGGAAEPRACKLWTAAALQAGAVRRAARDATAPFRRCRSDSRSGGPLPRPPAAVAATVGNVALVSCTYIHATAHATAHFRRRRRSTRRTPPRFGGRRRRRWAAFRHRRPARPGPRARLPVPAWSESCVVRVRRQLGATPRAGCLARGSVTHDT